jgi:hypothetical protein
MCVHSAFNWDLVYQCRGCGEIVPEEMSEDKVYKRLGELEGEAWDERDALLRVARAGKRGADSIGKFMDLYFDDLTPEHINWLGQTQDELYEALKEVEHLLD